MDVFSPYALIDDDLSDLICDSPDSHIAHMQILFQYALTDHDFSDVISQLPGSYNDCMETLYLCESSCDAL